MYGTVIVGFNASPQAEDALAFGEALRREMGSRLIVAACVVDSFNRPGGRYVASLRREANDSLASARSALDDDRAVAFRVVSAKTAAEALHQLAVEQHADLIVVGATHRHRATEAISHSVTHQVIRSAPCPVAVAPMGFRERAGRDMRSIVVAYDDTPEGAEALMQGVALAEAADAALTVVHAYRLDSPGVLAVAYGETDEIEGARARAKSRLEHALRLVPKGVEVRPVLVEGDPHDAIVEMSASADLLFMGSRAYGLVRRTVAGSVSSRVVRDAGCPTIVVPRPAVTSAAAA